MENKKVPNPWGKKGSPEHQNAVTAIENEIFANDMLPITEYEVLTPAGKKTKRFVDVAAIDRQSLELIELYQTGLTNKNGEPIKRERDAIEDIENAKGIKVIFRPYKIIIFVLLIPILTFLLNLL